MWWFSLPILPFVFVWAKGWKSLSSRSCLLSGIIYYHVLHLNVDTTHDSEILVFHPLRSFRSDSFTVDLDSWVLTLFLPLESVSLAVTDNSFLETLILQGFRSHRPSLPSRLTLLVLPSLGRLLQFVESECPLPFGSSQNLFLHYYTQKSFKSMF